MMQIELTTVAMSTVLPTRNEIPVIIDTSMTIAIVTFNERTWAMRIENFKI